MDEILRAKMDLLGNWGEIKQKKMWKAQKHDKS